MGFRFPFSNLSELNLDWVLSKVKEITDKVNSQLHDLTEIEEKVDNAVYSVEYMTVEADTLQPGEDATATKSIINGHINIEFGIPKGEQGEQGIPGQDGRDGQDATDAQVQTAVNTWLTNNVDPDSGYVLDNTLTQPLAAAPADLVGEIKAGIAGEFNASYSYQIGSFVWYQGSLYCFVKYHAANTPWDASEVTVTSLNASVRNSIYNVAPYFSESHSYTAGDYVVYYNMLFKFTSDHPAGAWDISHVMSVHAMDAFNDVATYEDIKNISKGGWRTFGLLPGVTSFSWSNSTALSPDAPIMGAYKTCYFSFEVGTIGTFKVGLYTINGTTATITHIEEVSATSIGVAVFNVLFDLDPEKTYYPFVVNGTGKFKYYSNTAENKYYSFPGSGISVGSTATVTTASGNGLSVVQCIALFKINSGDNGIITVAKKGGDFTTIQAAVSNALNGETIIVYPGVYEEYVACKRDVNSKTHIVGIDKENCIIKWESGKYAESTISVYGDFLLENLTIIANHDSAGGWYPTWVDGTPSTYASYAVHVDGYTLDYSGNKGIIRNCNIYSECSHAIGAGAQIGYSVILEDCNIERYVTDANYLNSNYDGALGCHSPNTNVGDIGSHFVMRNCFVKNNNTKALQLLDVYVGSPFDAEIIGSTFVDGSGIDNVIKFMQTTDDMITNTSHGNSTDEVNYRAIHA